MVHAMAQERGLLATFMPKPFANLTGNGGHIHMSLWDASGEPTCSPTTTTRGLGLSQLAYQFTGGLSKHARPYIAVDRADRQLVQAADRTAAR